MFRIQDRLLVTLKKLCELLIVDAERLWVEVIDFGCASFDQNLIDSLLPKGGVIFQLVEVALNREWARRIFVHLTVSGGQSFEFTIEGGEAGVRRPIEDTGSE